MGNQLDERSEDHTVIEKRRRALRTILIIIVALIVVGGVVYSIWWFRQPRPGHVQDEALLAGRTANTFPAADEDYFHDMDGGIDLVAAAPSSDKKALIRGRDTWIV